MSHSQRNLIMTGKTMAGYTFANGVWSFKTKDSRYKRPAWLFFPHFLIKTVIGLTRRRTVCKAQFLSSAHIHYNRVQPYSVGCIKIKGAVKVSLTVLQRAKTENEHMGIIELWVKTAEANQVWFSQCSGGLIEKQKVSDSVQFSQSVGSLSPQKIQRKHMQSNMKGNTFKNIKPQGSVWSQKCSTYHCC